MAFKTASESASMSLLPVYGRNKTEYVFWDAIRLSDIMREYSGLEYQKHLGDGRTFSVDLHRETSTDEAEAKLVAVKTARLYASSHTSDSPRVDLFALLMEIQVLQYEPLQMHPNIIDVLGMDWMVTDGTPAPRLIVEYAQFGTMDEYLQSHSVGIYDKINLCFDIASGLEMVHRCGVVHCDMKLPNTLVFEGEGRRVAKISDFGSALTKDDLEAGRNYRGTPAYYAPELTKDVDLALEDLRKCDVFAFGLCMWEILKNGLPYKESEPTTAQEPTILGAGRPLLEMFDIFLESVLGYVPPLPIGSDAVPVSVTDTGKLKAVTGDPISLPGAFRKLVHHTIHPVAGERYTMNEIVKILQRSVPKYNKS